MVGRKRTNPDLPPLPGSDHHRPTRRPFHYLPGTRMPPTARKTAKTTTTRKAPPPDPVPVFTIDTKQLWAASVRAGLEDPITAKAIAEYVGIPEATLSRVLAGKRRPPASMLAALAVAFPTAYPRIARAVIAPNGKP